MSRNFEIQLSFFKSQEGCLVAVAELKACAAHFDFLEAKIPLHVELATAITRLNQQQQQSKIWSSTVGLVIAGEQYYVVEAALLVKLVAAAAAALVHPVLSLSLRSG